MLVVYSLLVVEPVPATVVLDLVERGSNGMEETETHVNEYVAEDLGV